MFIGGSIDLTEEKEEINCALWEYQVTDTKWLTFPKSISLLIERQWRNQKNIDPKLQKYSPIFYQKSNGNKFKINVENSLQFDLQNESVAMIQRQNNSETKSLNYNKCPHCGFKVAASAKICDICNTNIQEFMFKQYNESGNKNNNKMIDEDVKIDKNGKILDLPQKEQPKQEPPPKNDNNSLEKDELLCPFCQTKNKINFNFCVGCSFDLREYQPLPKSDNNNNNNNNNNGNDKKDVKIDSMKVDNNNNNNNMNINNNPNDDFDPFADDLDGADDNIGNNNNNNSNNNNNGIFDLQQPGSGNVPDALNIADDGDVLMDGQEGGEGGEPIDNNNNNNNNNEKALEFAQNW